MKFEFKKLYRNKIFIVSILFMLIYISIISYKNIKSKSYYIETNNEVTYLTGLSAVKAEKYDRSSLYGRDIDKELLTEYLKTHKDVINGKYDNLDDTLKYIKYQQKYDDIMVLVAKSYASVNSFDLDIADNLNTDDLDRFYENRTEQLDIYLNKTEFKNYKFTEKEKNFLLKENDKLKTPIKYSYYKGWEILLSDFFINSILFAIFTNLIVANIFTADYSNNMNEILFTTVNKKQIIRNKIKTGICTGTLLFLLPHLIYAMIILLTLGTDGFSTPIQIYQVYWNSVYNLNFLQAYLLALILGVLITNIFLTVNMIVSILFKKQLISIGVVIAFNFIPLALYEGSGKLLKKVLSVSMINLYNNEAILLNYKPIFKIFNHEILQGYAMIPICIITGIVLIYVLNIIAKKNYRYYR